eukprot:2355119-Heterocapsa_arctica.AAC.2
MLCVPVCLLRPLETDFLAPGCLSSAPSGLGKALGLSVGFLLLLFFPDPFCLAEGLVFFYEPLELLSSPHPHSVRPGPVRSAV